MAAKEMAPASAEDKFKSITSPTSPSPLTSTASSNGSSRCFRCDRRLNLQKAPQYTQLHQAGGRTQPSGASWPSDELIVCHPFWQNDLICGPCAANAKRCVVCERPTRGWSEPWLSLATSPGRESFFLCHCCYSTGVARSEEDLVDIIQDVIRFLAQHPQINIDIRQYFRVIVGVPSAAHRIPFSTDGVATSNRMSAVEGLKSSSENERPFLCIQYTGLHSLCQRSPHLTYTHSSLVPSTVVSAWSEELVFGKFQARVTPNLNSAASNSSSASLSSRSLFPLFGSPVLKDARELPVASPSSFYPSPVPLIPLQSCDVKRSDSVPVYTVQLCHKLQKDTLASVLAHEILHAVLSVCGVSLNLDFEEAICNAMSVLFLNDQAQRILGTHTPSSRGQLDRDRISICRFRCRRLMVGDTPSTSRLAEAMQLVANGQWKENLGLV